MDGSNTRRPTQNNFVLASEINENSNNDFFSDDSDLEPNYIGNVTDRYINFWKRTRN